MYPAVCIRSEIQMKKNTSLTPGKKAARTKKLRAAGKKAALTRKHRSAGKKAALTRKRRAAARKAVATRKRRALVLAAEPLLLELTR
jgi:hypothetical protein